MDEVHATLTTHEYTAICVVPTPSFDHSGLSHLVEHMVFRYSPDYPSGHDLFVANTLLPVSINASALDDCTLFYITGNNAEVFAACLKYLQAGLDCHDYPSDALLFERDGVLQRELRYYESHQEYIKQVAPLRTNLSSPHAGGFSDVMPHNCQKDVRRYKQICYAKEKQVLLLSEHALSIEDIAKMVQLDNTAQSLTLSKKAKDAIAENIDKYPQSIQSLLSKIKIPDDGEHHESFSDLSKYILQREIKTVSELPNQNALPKLPSYDTTESKSVLANHVKQHLSISNIPPLPRTIKHLLKQPEKDRTFNNFKVELVENTITIKDICHSSFWEARLSGQCYAMGLGRDENGKIYRYWFG